MRLAVATILLRFSFRATLDTQDLNALVPWNDDG
jgi:hypothetical protein